MILFHRTYQFSEKFNARLDADFVRRDSIRGVLIGWIVFPLRRNRINELSIVKKPTVGVQIVQLSKGNSEGETGTNPSGNWHEKLTPIVPLARVIHRLTPWTLASGRNARRELREVRWVTVKHTDRMFLRYYALLPIRVDNYDFHFSLINNISLIISL